jgi:LacI family transcriptional regulator
VRRILVESDYAAVWRDLLDGIALYIQERRAPWELLCVTSEELPAAIAQRPDGALCTLHRSQAGVLRQLRRAGIPGVNMFRDVFPALPSVLSDHRAIGRAAATYFLDRGFRKFAFLGPDRDWSQQRADGFREFLRKAGYRAAEAQPNVNVGHYRSVSNDRTLRMLHRWLDGLSKPVAILAAADFVARPLLQACREHGWNVPEEIAVLGVDNDVAICELAPVSLSSIPQNLHRIGFESARLLDGIMSGRRYPARPVFIPPRQLVVRRSTDTFAFADTEIARIMQMIHKNPAGLPTMKDILQEVSLSRQWVDRRFKASVGRTVSEEIRRAKLQHARSLLAHTHLPVSEISRRCGFPHAENFARFFRNVVGSSPREFRERHRA